jgi:hypothetical protein
LVGFFGNPGIWKRPQISSRLAATLSGDYFVQLSLFSVFISTANTDGGALSLSSSSESTQSLIESSFFLNCGATRNGGGLFVSGGQIIINKCSGKGCIANNGHFFRCEASTQPNSKNYVVQTSATQSGESSHPGVITAWSGQQQILSVNSSGNSRQYAPGIFLNLGSTQADISSSSFCNNTAVLGAIASLTLMRLGPLGAISPGIRRVHAPLIEFFALLKDYPEEIPGLR